MNLKYMKVSLFEISCKKNFHDILIYLCEMHLYAILNSFCTDFSVPELYLADSGKYRSPVYSLAQTHRLKML